MKNSLLSRLVAVAALSIGLLLSVPAITAQMSPPTAAGTTKTANPKFDFSSSYTSAAQLKDLKSTDPFYAAVQNMLDEHGFIYAYDDGRFHPELALTREQLAVYLESGLAKLAGSISNQNKDFSRLVGSANANSSDTSKVFYSEYSANHLNIDANHMTRVISISRVKDVGPSDEVRTPLQSLMERYGEDFLDADYNFHASKAVSQKEFYAVMKGIFGYVPREQAAAGDAPIARGEFITIFNDALSRAALKIR